MQRLLCMIIAVFIFAVWPAAAGARPQKGFHTGPYLALQGGIMQTEFDYDETVSSKTGRDFEPSLGFIFGWNIWDFFSAELQGRYATDLNSGRREHIAAANVYAKFTLITDALTDFEHVRILPFVKVGPSIYIASLPGSPNAPSGSVTSVGFGPSFGGGVTFQIVKYLYVGIDVQGDLLTFSDINQTVNGVPNTLIYKGGFYPSFGGLITAGVHY